MGNNNHSLVKNGNGVGRDSFRKYTFAISLMHKRAQHIRVGPFYFAQRCTFVIQLNK